MLYIVVFYSIEQSCMWRNLSPDPHQGVKSNPKNQLYCGIPSGIVLFSISCKFASAHTQSAADCRRVQHFYGSRSTAVDFVLQSKMQVDVQLRARDSTCTSFPINGAIAP